MKDLSDEELMIQYQNGDQQAFEALFHRHSSKVLGFLKKRILDAEFREEVFQNTFLRLHTTRDRYNPELKFLPWLFTLTQSSLIDAYRKEKRHVREPLPTDLPSLETPQTSDKDFQQILSQLSPQDQKILRMRFESEQSFEEIAQAVGSPAATIRQRFHRAIKALRRQWDLSSREES